MRTLYIDLDGVIAIWNTKAPYSKVCSPGYFLFRKKQWNMGIAVFLLWIKGMMLRIVHKGYRVSFLSKAPSRRAGIEKRLWLKSWGILAPISCIIVPYERSKNEYVSEDNSVLIDDFGPNLKEWKGTSIKFYNGINGNNHTWYRYSINKDMSAGHIAKYVSSVMMAEKE